MELVTTSTAPPGPPARASVASSPEPTRLKLTGPLHTLRLPEACAACGAPARGTLRVEKRFRRSSDDSTRYVYEALDVPFCDGCRAAHARELPPVDPAVLRRLRWQFIGRTVPYWIPLGVLAYLFAVALLPMAGSLVREGLAPRTASGQWNWGLLIGVGVLAFFSVCLYAFVTLVNNARNDLIAPYDASSDDHYVRRARLLFGDNAVFLGPPTSVLAAANFTDDRSELFEPERRTSTFRDPVFAAQFAALNADRVWSAKAPRARLARRARNVVFALLLVFGGLAMLNDWTGGALWSAVTRVFGEYVPQ
jgi:hypothetical protein